MTSVPALPGEVTAETVVALAVRQGLTVATAESLTAGMIASSLADVPGASSVLRGGVVAYQVDVKRDLLRVDPGLLRDAGAVDPRVASAMAEGTRALFAADIGIATTGVAGPSAHEGKAVGTVFTAISAESGTRTFEHHFPGDRRSIRESTRNAVLGALTDFLVDLSRGTNDHRG